MKRKIILAITVLSIFLTGCSSSKEEKKIFNDGKEALEKHDYKLAMEHLSAALQEDNNDEQARAMYNQATKMINAIRYEEEKNYKKAIKELEFIEEIKGGLSSIKSEASSKKKEIMKEKEEYDEAVQQRKENAKSVASKDKNRIERDALQNQRKQEEEKIKAQQEKEALENENKVEEENDDEIKLEPPTINSPQVQDSEVKS